MCIKKEDKNLLGAKIRELRHSRNYTQEDLAQKLKISKSTIGMYEQDRRSPDLEILLKLAHIFNVSTDYLLDNVTFTSTKARKELSQDDIKLLNYYHNFSQSCFSKEQISDFFPTAMILRAEEKELIEYYNELSLKDRRWIMGQMIDLIKKSDKDKKDLEIPKAQ